VMETIQEKENVEDRNLRESYFFPITKIK